jgi:hypothetical protein
MAGYDLNVLPSQSIVYGSWDGFGLPADTIAQIDILTGVETIHPPSLLSALK